MDPRRDFVQRHGSVSVLKDLEDLQSFGYRPRNVLIVAAARRLGRLNFCPYAAHTLGGGSARAQLTLSGSWKAPPTTPELTLQLLPLPQPILVDTTTRRDHEVPVRYRDEHGRWHAIVDVAGPDRVSGGEWESAFAREYFKCVREDGTLVWMFMARDERVAHQAKDHWWFLQGWWD